MNTNKEKIYAVWAYNTYLTDIHGNEPIYSVDMLSAKYFKTYREAYNMAQRANRIEGWKKCFVCHTTADDWNAYTWSQIKQSVV